MKDGDFSKLWGELINETMALQDLEMEVERKRLKVSRMQYELENVLCMGVPANTFPMPRSLQ